MCQRSLSARVICQAFCSTSNASAASPSAKSSLALLGR
jgi:hypothetical protein